MSMRCVMQAEYGDDAVKQLRQREAEERRAARAAREQGEIDVNQIPLGEKVHIQQLHAQPHLLRHGMPAQYRSIAGGSSERLLQVVALPEGCDLSPRAHVHRHHAPDVSGCESATSKFLKTRIMC